MKFLVFGAVTGAVMIYGLTFWFGGIGSTLFSELGGVSISPLVMAAGLVAVIVGLGYKAALVPFHFWAPDAYDGAPVSVAAYLSVITKIAAIFAFAQVLRDLPAATGWPLIIALIAVPLIIQSYGIFTIAFGWGYAWNVPFNIAAPAALIGTSNFFELAVAVAISLFGLNSGAALATVVGVLVEVPVMLSLVAFANWKRGAFQP